MTAKAFQTLQTQLYQEFWFSILDEDSRFVIWLHVKFESDLNLIKTIKNVKNVKNRLLSQNQLLIRALRERSSQCSQSFEIQTLNSEPATRTRFELYRYSSISSSKFQSIDVDDCLDRNHSFAPLSIRILQKNFSFQDSLFKIFSSKISLQEFFPSGILFEFCNSPIMKTSSYCQTLSARDRLQSQSYMHFIIEFSSSFHVDFVVDFVPNSCRRFMSPDYCRSPVWGLQERSEPVHLCKLVRFLPSNFVSKPQTAPRTSHSKFNGWPPEA